MRRAERVMLEAYRAFSSAAEAGGAIVLRVPEAPDSPMLNRVVGLGVETPATEAGVDDALAAIGPGGHLLRGDGPGGPASRAARVAARART
jgi:hypothetical protein